MEQLANQLMTDRERQRLAAITEADALRYADSANDLTLRFKGLA